MAAFGTKNVHSELRFSTFIFLLTNYVFLYFYTNLVMRMLRKGPQAMKCKQYQIVAVTGVFANQQESALHKVIQSKRIP